MRQSLLFLVYTDKNLASEFDFQAFLILVLFFIIIIIIIIC
jgi:hypothetical protein